MEIMQTTQIPIRLTQGAIEEIKRLRLRETDPEKAFLRIGVKGGGCAGFSYVLQFDSKQEGDEMFEIEGIPILMNVAHGLYLTGVEIDFEQGLNNRGFTYNNPNASTTCGCGTSFS